jgi:hypothetical protein
MYEKRSQGMVACHDSVWGNRDGDCHARPYLKCEKGGLLLTDGSLSAMIFISGYTYMISMKGEEHPDGSALSL